VRLSEFERRSIVEEVRYKAPGALIYLYGSRTDDQLRGGDIDLLVIAPEPELEYGDRVDLLMAIKRKIGQQRIDLKILTPERSSHDEFAQAILPNALQLG